MNWQAVAMLAAPVLVLLTMAPVAAEEKILVGRIEEALLLPEGIRLPARIDTGAAICSLDARDLTIRDDAAEFRLPEAYGSLRLRLPVVRWGHVRSTKVREKRPIVEIGISLGGKHLRVEATLADRSQFKYPLLIGRNALKQGFVVDVSKWNVAPPDNERKARAP